jgi:creatinine amidohydrolase
MTDVCEGLYRQKLRKVLFLNGHSGNTPILQEICNILRDRGGIGFIVDWWNLVGYLLPDDALSGHGDRLEASAVLAFDPKLVKMDAAKPHRAKNLTERIEVASWQKVKFRSAEILTWVKSEDGSESGNFGSLNDTTRERGERALSAVTEYVLDLIQEIQKIDLKKLG